MLLGPNKPEEPPSCRGAQMNDDSFQTPSDQQDKSHTDFNFPAFVSLFYSVPRDVESNNSFLLCAWTQCTASVFVRNSIIKQYMNGKTKSTVFSWCLPVVWPLFPSASFFCLSASRSFNKASCRVWLSGGTRSSVAGLGLAVVVGGQHFRLFPPCNTPCSLEPPPNSPLRLFFPSVLISFLSILLFLLCLLTTTVLVCISFSLLLSTTTSFPPGPIVLPNLSPTVQITFWFGPLLFADQWPVQK